MENLEKRVEELERDNKSLNTMLIIAFIHILVIVIVIFNILILVLR